MSKEYKHIEKKKSVIPKLRFKEFDEVSSNSSYKKYLFNDIFLFSTGKNIKQNEASPEYETPCVRYGELYHMYNEVINKVFNRTNIDKSELRFSHGDEILLPSAGEDPLDIGSASALTIDNVAIGRTINILKPLKANIYSQIYVAYYINQKLRKKISTLAKGVSISNVYNSDLKTLEIILPNLPEQQKIASFLSEVDEKIQQLSRKKELLEQYKKGVMQQLFLGKLRFKDENGKAFPKWEVKRLGDMLSFVVDNRGKTPPITNEGYPMIEINAIGKNAINYSVVEKFVSEEVYNTWFRKYLEPGDILFSTVGATALCSIYDSKKVAVIAQNLVGLRFKSDNELFMFYLLTEEKNNHKFKRIEMGAVQPSVKVSQMINIEFKVPVIEEQKKIANYLSSMDIKLELVNKQITQTQTFKKGLLQQMFV
jgi:type I restriction enzyme S subunit